MKSFWLRQAQCGTLLEGRETPVPEPSAGQILVRMRAAGLNRGEFIARRDLHGASAEPKPSGNEGAGEVAAVGSGVSRFKAGDRAMGVCMGAFSEYVLMDERVAMQVPARLSWEAAAVTPLVFLLTHDMLIAQGRLKPGEWVLVCGASSGVGVATLLAARALGAHVIGTSSSDVKLEKLARLGMHAGVRTRGPGFNETVMRATGGKGADVIINALGGTVFEECLRSLAFEGRLAAVGYVDGVSDSRLDIAALHAKRLRLFGVSALMRTPEQRIATVRGFESDLLPFFADGRIEPVIDRVFDFDELPAAKAHMESNAHLGKIAVKIGA